MYALSYRRLVLQKLVLCTPTIWDSCIVELDVPVYPLDWRYPSCLLRYVNGPYDHRTNGYMYVIG